MARVSDEKIDKALAAHAKILGKPCQCNCCKVKREVKAWRAVAESSQPARYGVFTRIAEIMEKGE